VNIHQCGSNFWPKTIIKSHLTTRSFPFLNRQSNTGTKLNLQLAVPMPLLLVRTDCMTKERSVLASIAAILTKVYALLKNQTELKSIPISLY